MTSSEGPKPNYSRRFFWLAVFIVLLFGGYSVAWFYVAGELESRTKAAIAKLNTNGVTAECANPTARGYPFRIGLYCDRLGYADASRKIDVTSGGLRTAAQIYQPMLALAELDGPLHVSAPGVAPLSLDWDNLRASVRLSRPLPQRVSLEATGLSGNAEPAGGEQLSLFKVARTEGHLRPNGADVDWAGSFTNLAIDSGAVGGRDLPVMNGAGDATLKNGVQLIETRAKNLRGQSVEFRQLDLSSGDAGVSLSGPVSVDENGLIDATLTIRIRNPTAVAAILAKAVPEAQSQITNGFAGLAVLGKEPTLPLKIVKGKASLGFIPLGHIPPV